MYAVMRRRALVVDDDPDIAEMLSSYLAVSECEIVSAPSAEAALALVAEGEFSALIIDLLTHEAGLHVIRKFRESNPSAFVILFTGWIDGDVTERGLNAGANVVLFKPLELGAVLRLLSRFFSAP